MAGDQGGIYVTNTNSGAPPGVIEFASDGTPSLLAGTGFATDLMDSTGDLPAMTRNLEGNILVWDDEADKYIQVLAGNGSATVFLEPDTLIPGADPDGGIAFASDGTLYAADDELGILRFPPPYKTGTVWVDARAILAETGGSTTDFDLNGGIAFQLFGQ